MAMRARCWTILVAASALPCSCGAPAPVQPVATPSPVASPAASFDPAALFSGASSGSASLPAAPVPQQTSPFHVVLTSPYPAPVVHCWNGGAFIITHGLMVAIKGADVLQRASWLTGLPEIVNWDADVSIELPPGAQVDSNLPAGTLLAVHAGNRHGPDESRLWDGKAWSARVPADDPRVLAAYRDINRYPIARMRLPGNRTIVVRPAQKGGLESLLFEPGGSPATVSPIPAKASDYTAWLIGPPESLRLCLPDGELFAWSNGRWTGELSADSGAIRGCAATASGTLWVADAKGTVKRRVGAGWEQVPLPPKVEAASIQAGGERIWLTAGEQVLSTEPIGREVRIEEGQLPGTVYFGISGLDATGPDLLNVSRDPAGPATAGCDSIVLVLGDKPGAEQRSLLMSDPSAAKLELFEAQGSEGGTLFVPPGAGAQMRLRPSTRTRKALYVLPPTFDEGMRIAGRLRAGGGEPKPALLCSIPRNARKLGPVSSMRE